jgi:thiol:disulfide interchange protein
MGLLLFLLAGWAGSIWAAQTLGARKGRHSCWLWGFFLGWIGVAVVAFLGDRYEKRNARSSLADDQQWAELVRRQAELDRQRAR